MKIAYFDCFAGIAGDMALGALLDCGVPPEELRQALSGLPVEPWTLDTEPVLRQGIHGLRVLIRAGGETDAEEAKRVARQQAAGDHQHHHHHHADDHHGHHDEERHHQHPAGESGHGRSLREIEELLGEGNLPPAVRDQSVAVFRRLAEAEGHIHHLPPVDVHFHEIGGLDSILDICGVIWCLHYLGVEQVQCSPLPSFTGWVECRHGRIPLPAPATQRLLEGIPLEPAGLEGEMVTPTGAGLVAELASRFGPPPPMTPVRTGYGAGTRDWPDRPNLLRVIIGDSAAATSDLEWLPLTQLETNVDDMNPQLLPGLLGTLLAAGAADAWLQPIQMKKGRPAWTVAVLCRPDLASALSEMLLRHSTSLGVRRTKVQRTACRRSMGTVDTPYGEVTVKWRQGEGLRHATPEFETVRQRAEAAGVPALEVYEAALAAIRAGRGGNHVE